MNKLLDRTLEFDRIKASDMLNNTLRTLPKKYIALGDLLECFDRRSFSSTFLLLALLCLLPGISVLAGFAMIFPAVQMALGFNTLTFPRFVREYKISVPSLKKLSARALPMLIKMESFVKPRYVFLSQMMMQRILGGLIIVLALIVAIPFPLSNYPPAIAVMFLSLGLLANDGLVILLGIVCSIFAAAIGFSMFYFLIAWLFF